jgi:hypothetical protein
MMPADMGPGSRPGSRTGPIGTAKTQVNVSVGRTLSYSNLDDVRLRSCLCFRLRCIEVRAVCPTQRPGHRPSLALHGDGVFVRMSEPQFSVMLFVPAGTATAAQSC